jgi:hypothetical protein
VVSKWLLEWDKTYSLTREPYCLGSFLSSYWTFPLVLSAIPINCMKNREICQQSPAKPATSGKQLPADMMLARILGPGATSSELPGELWKVQTLSPHHSRVRLLLCHRETKPRRGIKKDLQVQWSFILQKQLLAGLHLCWGQNREMRCMLWQQGLRHLRK